MFRESTPVTYHGSLRQWHGPAFYISRDIAHGTHVLRLPNGETLWQVREQSFSVAARDLPEAMLIGG